MALVASFPAAPAPSTLWSRVSVGEEMVQVAVAAMLSLTAFAVEEYARSLSLTFVAVLFLFGVPHGATMRGSGGPVTPSPIYAFAYLCGAAALIASFALAPAIGVASFLFLSAIHFARSERGALPAIGIFATFAAFLFHPAAASDLVDTITDGSRWTSSIVTAGAAIAALSLALLLIDRRTFGCRRSAIRVAVVTALFALLSPLTAMGIYFAALHSLPEYAAGGPRPSTIGASPFLPFGAIAISGGVLLCTAVANGYIPVSMMAITAMGFALPHMIDEIAGQAVFASAKRLARRSGVAAVR